MKRAIMATTVGLLLASTSAVAQSTVNTIPVNDAAAADRLSGAAQLPYTFAALRYMQNEYQVNNPDSTVDGDGFGIEGSYLFLPSFYAVGSYSMIETDNIQGFNEGIELDELTLGAGYRMDLTATADFNGSLRVVRQEASFAGNTSDDEIGYLLGAGARGVFFIPQFEARAEVTYLDIAEDGDLFLNLGGLYRFDRWVRGLAAGADITLNNDTTSLALTGRWAF
jgi:hypothetical protein